MTLLILIAMAAATAFGSAVAWAVEKLLDFLWGHTASEMADGDHLAELRQWQIQRSKMKLPSRCPLSAEEISGVRSDDRKEV